MENENNVLVKVTNDDIKYGTVVIPDSVEYIGVYAFAFCKQLKEIVIPDSVKSIGKGAFDGCKSLENIVLSDSVKMIGDYAFCCCSSLEEIDRKSTRLNSSHSAKYLVCRLLLEKKLFLMIRRPPRSTLFPTRRSSDLSH